MKFTKMHGLGNDFIILDQFREEIPDPIKLASRMCDRHFGVGAEYILYMADRNYEDYPDVYARNPELRLYLVWNAN